MKTLKPAKRGPETNLLRDAMLAIPATTCHIGDHGGEIDCFTDNTGHRMLSCTQNPGYHDAHAV